MRNPVIQVFAQRLNADREYLWTENGIAISVLVDSVFDYACNWILKAMLFNIYLRLSGQPLAFALHDIYGRKIYASTVIENNRLDMHFLPAGIYQL